MWIETDYEYSQLSVKHNDAVKRVAQKINDYVSTVMPGDSAFSSFNNKKCAYVTFASPSYHFGLKTLTTSIRRHSNIPIIVLASRRWDFQPEASGIYLLAVPRLYNERYNSSRAEIKETLAKLWVFGLLALDRVVFLELVHAG